MYAEHTDPQPRITSGGPRAPLSRTERVATGLRAHPRLLATFVVASLAALIFANWPGRDSDAGTAVSPSAARSTDSAGGNGTSPEFAAPQADEKTQAAAAVDPASPAGLLSLSPMTAKRVRNADLQVQVPDIGGAAAKIRSASTSLGGSVASENSQTAANGGYAQDVMVIRVPEPQLDEAISAVTATGKELSRTSSSEDVTATLADLTSRESSQRASVERVRDLMAQAKTLSEVVLLEAELSRRETDLEAAEASRRALSDQAAQATLTVTLTTSSTPPARKPVEQNGFMAGLHDGWDALQASTAVVLTVLGAILPIGVVLLVIGVPAYLITRRRRTNANTAVAQP